MAGTILNANVGVNSDVKKKICIVVFMMNLHMALKGIL
jgi:hypothetical protein